MHAFIAPKPPAASTTMCPAGTMPTYKYWRVVMRAAPAFAESCYSAMSPNIYLDSGLRTLPEMFLSVQFSLVWNPGPCDAVLVTTLIRNIINANIR